MMGMPAIVIGDHGDRGVAQLRLARELGLGHVGHADHRAAPGTIELGFGTGGKLRPFHDHVGAAAHHRQPGLRRRRGECVAEPAAHRIGHRHMGGEAGLEKRFAAGEGAVDELIDQNEHARRQLFLERTHRRQGDDFRDAGALQRIDVGGEVDLGRRNGMAAAVARQKDQPLALIFGEHQFVRRPAEGRLHRPPRDIFKTLDVVEPAAADDTQHGWRARLAHRPLPHKITGRFCGAP